MSEIANLLKRDNLKKYLVKQGFRIKRHDARHGVLFRNDTTGIVVNVPRTLTIKTICSILKDISV